MPTKEWLVEQLPVWVDRDKLARSILDVYSVTRLIFSIGEKWGRQCAQDETCE